MVTSSQGSSSSAINVSVSSDGFGQQGATDSMGEALVTGQLAALQTLENETHLSPTNMYATGRNGCMGLNGCAQPPTYLLSCPHRRVGRRMCSKCLIRIPFDERCLCENEDFDIIRPDLVEIHDWTIETIFFLKLYRALICLSWKLFISIFLFWPFDLVLWNIQQVYSNTKCLFLISYHHSSNQNTTNCDQSSNFICFSFL